MQKRLPLVSSISFEDTRRSQILTVICHEGNLNQIYSKIYKWATENGLWYIFSVCDI
jgi:hypothetical protein